MDHFETFRVLRGPIVSSSCLGMPDVKHSGQYERSVEGFWQDLEWKYFRKDGCIQLGQNGWTKYSNDLALAGKHQAALPFQLIGNAVSRELLDLVRVRSP
jgi:hypothetical protein